MDKLELPLEFDNPNSAEDTADILFNFFFAINKSMVDDIINDFVDGDKKCIKYSA